MAEAKADAKAAEAKPDAKPAAKKPDAKPAAGGKKDAGGAKKGAPAKKKGPVRKSAAYEVSGEKISRKKPVCPKCGPGVFMATHADRRSCGKCGYTEKSKKQ